MNLVRSRTIDGTYGHLVALGLAIFLVAGDGDLVREHFPVIVDMKEVCPSFSAYISQGPTMARLTRVDKLLSLASSPLSPGPLPFLRLLLRQHITHRELPLRQFLVVRAGELIPIKVEDIELLALFEGLLD